MELRAWAERVLTGTAWEDKLWDPSELTDEDPGSSRSVECPGRPPEYPFRARGQGTGPGSFETRAARGELLHAFANHELLAIELMALALLRFTDAPAAFRRGIASTLREEQTHLRLYRDALARYDVRLGDVPGSGFFWTAMSTVAGPAAYLAHMALTFEQANLDFAAHYAEAFREVGDDATAEVLDRVLEDEIGHVGFGVRWLRRLCPDVDLLAAHERALHWPVTPGRARGIRFFDAPRRAAGLPEQYIEAVRTYARPRGGRPVVRWYNPFAEEEIAVGPGHRPPEAVRQTRSDLALTPIWMAAPDDVVLVDRRPSGAFLDGLAPLVDLPRFAVVDFEHAPTAQELPAGAVALEPWAGTPRTDAWSRNWRDAIEPGHDGAAWRPERRPAFGKRAAARLLRRLLEEPCPGLMPAEDAPRVAMSMDEVDANVSRFASGYEVVAVKSDLGTSGRGIERLVGPATPAQRRAIERRLRRDGCVIVEPWVDRVCDLSFRFTRAGDGTVGLDDIGRFLTDERGQYRGAVLGRATTGLPSEVRRFVAELGPQGLDDVAQRVADGLAADPAYAGIEGPLGVDAMIYRQPTGRLALRPVVEVNPRHNMGHVAWRIGQCVAPGRAAVWMIIGQTTVPGGDMRGFVERCVEANPPVLRRDGQTRRLDAGVVPTSDPATAKRCVAMLSVARTLRDALSAVDQRMIG